MNKFQSIVLLTAACTAIAIVAIIGSVFILSDSNRENDTQVVTVFSFAAGIIAGVIVLGKMLMGLHDTLNSRLDQLLDARGEASHAAGVEAGRKGEREHPMSETQSVVIVPDPENPIPVVPVSPLTPESKP